ncbi:UNVERIFIED_CONTAM: TetR/AcrR family transcriptional regulator C-terminal ligand-binding domain-containing protein [Pseudomonas aeruginosa]|uniref:TetR/AcrR family transcriptional regulator n=1 Tax=Pseudomonas aeruginosa TaxID=287 RepID=UPI001C95DEF9|nr:TetR/AcrR family transcriptional regulator [Pseudomonas aeruginosa]
MQRDHVSPHSSKPAAGRPRSEEATAAALETALAIAYEEDLSKVNMEHIAQKSGVSKAALYRRWPNAWAIVMEAFFNDLAPSLVYDSEIRITSSFKMVAKNLIREMSGPRGVLLSKLFAAAQMDASLQRAFLEKWINPRRDAAKEIIEIAKQRGEIRKNVNPEILIDTIYGAIYYRMTIPHAPVEETYSIDLVDMIFSGILTLSPAQRFEQE